MLPNFDEERFLWKSGYNYVAGVDEVGRGCFAGPVVSAAVILPSDFTATDEINDSKLLTPEKREMLSDVIIKHALSYSIAEINVAAINKHGIGKATQMSFRKAIKLLHVQPEYILIDAFYINRLRRNNQKPIVHGDNKSISIAAASIVAKVYRDNIMRNLHSKYNIYDFFTNKGYGTKKHREAIRLHGLSNLHRTSFSLTKFTATVIH